MGKKGENNEKSSKNSNAERKIQSKYHQQFLLKIAEVGRKAIKIPKLKRKKHKESFLNKKMKLNILSLGLIKHLRRLVN